MTESLTSGDIKRAVHLLRAAQARITKPCPDCGGESWAEDEITRCCPICCHIWVTPYPVARESGERLHNILVEALNE